ncbi:MAG: magnesium transporter [Candidatus Colwellbacteria bacterium]|jgi:magnesium transporter|nr:magnesium transporter [Candidatus Colwellbacteria bacterium]MCK9497569.1 magnesium transporter [Candidatus Colwellbacteria bacterium]MDD3752839.1 magnesium transporter [Candidatus Colwellbacteria bacterium]
MNEKDKKVSVIKYAEDDKLSVRVLLFMRIPPLVAGLLLGIGLSFLTSRFEEVIAVSPQVAFFIPFVVYMADAVGTQTQNIYIRGLRSGKAKFKKYLLKETALGIILGFFCGAVSWMAVWLWFDGLKLANAVGLSMFSAITIAPLIALIVAELLQLEHRDPAVGAGPITTVIQDSISVAIYGIIATMMLL